jgi:hypothetical protein
MTTLLFLHAVILTAIWFVLLPAPAQAYFDVNTGTYILQLVFGFGAAFWLSIKSTFAKRKMGPAIESNKLDAEAPSDSKEH